MKLLKKVTSLVIALSMLCAMIGIAPAYAATDDGVLDGEIGTEPVFTSRIYSEDGYTLQGYVPHKANDWVFEKDYNGNSGYAIKGVLAGNTAGVASENKNGAPLVQGVMSFANAPVLENTNQYYVVEFDMASTGTGSLEIVANLPQGGALNLLFANAGGQKRFYSPSAGVTSPDNYFFASKTGEWDNYKIIIKSSDITATDNGVADETDEAHDVWFYVNDGLVYKTTTKLAIRYQSYNAKYFTGISGLSFKETPTDSKTSADGIITTGAEMALYLDNISVSVKNSLPVSADGVLNFDTPGVTKWLAPQGTNSKYWENSYRFEEAGAGTGSLVNDSVRGNYFTVTATSDTDASTAYSNERLNATVYSEHNPVLTSTDQYYVTEFDMALEGEGKYWTAATLTDGTLVQLFECATANNRYYSPMVNTSSGANSYLFITPDTVWNKYKVIVKSSDITDDDTTADNHTVWIYVNNNLVYNGTLQLLVRNQTSQYINEFIGFKALQFMVEPTADGQTNTISIDNVSTKVVSCFPVTDDYVIDGDTDGVIPQFVHHDDAGTFEYEEGIYRLREGPNGYGNWSFKNNVFGKNGYSIYAEYTATAIDQRMPLTITPRYNIPELTSTSQYYTISFDAALEGTGNFWLCGNANGDGDLTLFNVTNNGTSKKVYSPTVENNASSTVLYNAKNGTWNSYKMILKSSDISGDGDTDSTSEAHEVWIYVNDVLMYHGTPNLKMRNSGAVNWLKSFTGLSFAYASSEASGTNKLHLDNISMQVSDTFTGSDVVLERKFSADSVAANEFTPGNKKFSKIEFASGVAGRAADDYSFVMTQTECYDDDNAGTNIYPFVAFNADPWLKTLNWNSPWSMEFSVLAGGQFETVDLQFRDNAGYKNMITLRGDRVVAVNGTKLTVEDGEFYKFNHNEWNHFMFNFDPDTDKVTIYHDGNKIFDDVIAFDWATFSNAKFNNSVVNPGVQDKRTCKMGLDDIYIYQSTKAAPQPLAVDVSTDKLDTTFMNNNVLIANADTTVSDVTDGITGGNVTLYTDNSFTAASSDVTKGNMAVINSDDGRIYKYFYVADASEGAEGYIMYNQRWTAGDNEFLPPYYTDNVINGIVIAASYQTFNGGSEMDMLDCNYISLDEATYSYDGIGLIMTPSAPLTLNVSKDATLVKMFCWNSISSLRPIAPEHICILKTEE